MRKIIIAGTGPKLISALEKLLGVSDIPIAYICTSASEVMAITRLLDDAVLICGPLKDTASIYLARTLPDTWDIILLLASNEPFPYYVSNIIPVIMPINRRELTQTVISVAGEMSETFATKTTAKQVRPADEKELIEKGKRCIMCERKLAESDAHRLLQKYSMNLGITMVEAAKRFIKS